MPFLDENSITKLKTNSLLTNNKFIVTIGPLLTSFSKIKGIGKSINYDTKLEGGVNEFVHVIRKNEKAESNILTLEKGIGRFNPLALVGSNALELGVKLPLPGSIIILDDEFEMRKMYTFDDIIILKWEVNELNALGNEIAIDTLQIMHSGLKDRSMDIR